MLDPVDAAEGFHIGRIDYLARIVTAIRQEGSNAEAARYHTDNLGKPTLEQVKFANTVVFEEMCSVASEWLRLILGHRLEIEGALRQERGD